MLRAPVAVTFSNAFARIALPVAVLGAACGLPGPQVNAVVLQNGAVRIVEQGNLAGQTPCSEGRAGLDRWCVFFAQKQTATRGQDVWVVDVSRIARSEDAECNEQGPGCLRLATGDHVVHWGFVADTLIIDGGPAAVMSAAQLAAPVTAWRPGWPAAVAITANPVSACSSDDVTESIACVEIGPAASASLDASVDAATVTSGTFYGGRLTQDRSALTVVSDGRAFLQALTTSDSMLVSVQSGVARLDLASGSVETLSAQGGSVFGVSADERWFLSTVSQKSDAAGTRSIAATPFPQGGARHIVLGSVLRHAVMRPPHAVGADVLAVAVAADGAPHLFLVGPDAGGATVSTDLGPWAGTTTDKLDTASAGGYAVVADTQGTAVLSLLAPGLPCVLGTSTVPLSQVTTVPALGDVLWVDAVAGAAGPGFLGAIAGCAKAQVFAPSAAGPRVERSRDVLFLDAAKHLYRLDLSTAGAQPAVMRDPDEVVYRWSYLEADDVLVLEMTSSFDTSTRLYSLRHPFGASP